MQGFRVNEFYESGGAMEFSKSLNRILSISILTLVFAGAAQADFDVEVAEAPTSNLNLTVSAIQSAKKSIHLNIYELSSPEIADAIIAKLQEGVQVQILEEGQPVGGMSAAAKGIEQQISQAMQQQRVRGSHLYIMTSKATQSKRRFHYDHGKYAVIDDTSLLIGSENYSPTGNPVPGSLGNRGWEVFIHEADIAANFEAMFLSDADPSQGDVMDATRASVLALDSMVGEEDFYARKPGSQKPPKGQKPPKQQVPPPKQKPGSPSGSLLSASSVERVTSPDSSLSGLVSLLDGAQETIDIQQMTFDSAWSTGNNPLIAAIRKAAKRGVRVRVLLNDESVFNHSSTTAKEKNQPTVDLLNQISGVEAKIADIKAMGVDYIHNKGALVDGNLTLISSINWDENSIQRNREAAVVLTSADVFAHYEALFDHDWQVSAAANSIVAKPATAPATQAVSCPQSIELSIQIGDLVLDSSDKDSYGSIANKSFAGTFERAPSANGCLLLGSGAATSTSKKQFIQIRSTSSGEKNIVYESYTPKGNKLFSVRVKVPNESNTSGEFDAGVYEGSATRSYLGAAILDIQEND